MFDIPFQFSARTAVWYSQPRLFSTLLYSMSLPCCCSCICMRRRLKEEAAGYTAVGFDLVELGMREALACVCEK